MKLQTFAKIRILPYPDNLLIDLGVTIPSNANTSFAADTIFELLNNYNSRAYAIIISVYKNKHTLGSVAKEQGISYERVRQLKNHAIWFLGLPANLGKIQCALMSQDNQLSIADVWEQALATGASCINPAYTQKLASYLRSKGVIFPINSDSLSLARLVDPRLAKQYPRLHCVHLYSLIGIFNLGLDNNVCNALYRVGITDLKSLVRLSGWDILGLRCIGVTRINKIVTQLADLGIQAQHLQDRYNRLSPYCNKNSPICLD